MEPVYNWFRNHFQNLVKFDKDTFKDFNDEKVLELKEKIEELKDGEILILDNLRQDLREKENDEDFAKKIASLGEIYVNEAFSVSHREHASMVGIPKFLDQKYNIK